MQLNIRDVSFHENKSSVNVIMPDAGHWQAEIFTLSTDSQQYHLRMYVIWHCNYMTPFTEFGGPAWPLTFPNIDVPHNEK